MKKNKTQIKKLKLKKEVLTNLPVFYNFIIYNCFEKGRLPSYHYNSEIQCYTDYSLFDKPISKITKE
jgi:hypothetical protein